MEEVLELQKKADGLFEQKRYKEVIDLLPDELLKKSNNATLYAGRARCYNILGEPDKAIEDCNKAISLEGNYEDAYFDRGLAWDNKGNYDKAIEDYTTAISYKEDADAYFNRASVWDNKGYYDKAIKDYTTAISLIKDDSSAYNNRGVSFYNKGEYDKAIADYDEAIKIDQKNSKAILNRDQLFAELGIPIAYSDVKADNAFYKITDSISILSDEEAQIAIMRFYKLYINPLIKNIRAKAAETDNIWEDAAKEENKTYNETDPKYVAHYSNLKIADIMIMKDPAKLSDLPKLRYSNAVFMNDPDEGQILIDCLDNMEKTDTEPGQIKKAFESVLKEEKNNFYLGSFLPEIQGHDDELLMWRTYGKDENQQEAAGCCMILNVNFFDKADGDNITLGKDKASAAVHPLYKVLYYNQRKNKFEEDNDSELDEGVKKLKESLKELLKLKEDVAYIKIKDFGKAIDKVLYHTLSELRYFFKSADYAYENELRVIQFATDSKVVKIEETSTLPRKLYIESTKEVKSHLRKIVLGPKVPHPERWLYLEKKMNDEGHVFEMKHSECHFQ